MTRLLFVTISIFFISNMAKAEPLAESLDVVKVIKVLDHGTYKKFITTAYSHDLERNVTCVSAIASGIHDSGTATTNKCFNSPKEPVFSAETYNKLSHTSKISLLGKFEREIKKTITYFKIKDTANDIVCYGTLAGNNNLGVSIDMDCL